MERLAAALVSWVALLLACAGREPAWNIEHLRKAALEPLPDVVIFVLDDVAASDVETMVPTPANPLRSLPSISALASQGMTCTRFYAHAWCAPTRDALLRSVNVGDGHGDWSCASPVPESLDFSAYNMARMFQQAGYHTAHLGKWHLGVPAAGGDWKDAITAFGFADTIDAFPVECEAPAGTGVPTLTNGVIERSPRNQLSAKLRDDFLAWWTTTPAPRFAVVNFEAAHNPWNYPAATLLPDGYPTPFPGTDRERFEAELVGADVAIGGCLAALDEGDWRLVIGDNGTPAGAERPDQDPTKIKVTCYEDGIRVPFVAAGPGIQAGTVCPDLGHVSDLLPTFRGVMGLSGPAVEGVPLGTRETVFTYSGPVQNAVSGVRWKLLTNSLGVEELYDLETDPHELTPLPAVGPIAAYLRDQRIAILGH